MAKAIGNSQVNQQIPAPGLTRRLQQALIEQQRHTLQPCDSPDIYHQDAQDPREHLAEDFQLEGIEFLEGAPPIPQQQGGNRVPF